MRPSAAHVADSYCVDLMRRNDEDLWLSWRYADPADAPALAALFALHIEVRRVPLAVSEPPLGEIRLQWWREALEEASQQREGAPAKTVRAHPVVAALQATGALDASSVRAQFDGMIDARARDLYADPFENAAEVTNHLAAAEGRLAQAAIGADASPAQADAVMRLASAWAVARHVRRLTEKCASPEVVSVALDAAAVDASAARRALRAAGALSPEIVGRLNFLSLTDLYLRRGPDVPLARRLTLLRAVMTGRL